MGLFLHPMSAQQISRTVYSTAGKFSTSSSLTLSSTIGETVVFTGFVSNAILTQGFEQPDKDILTIIPSTDFLTKVDVFPNPVTDQLQIRINTDQPLTDLSFEIDDMLGNKVKVIPVAIDGLGNQAFSFDFLKFSAGVYTVKIFSQTNHIHKAFKVIKK